jgi:hypothetical protein
MEMRDHWGNPIGAVRDDSLAQPANDLTRRELRDLVSDAVYRGALKAIGVCLLMSAVVWIVVRIIAVAAAG